MEFEIKFTDEEILTLYDALNEASLSYGAYALRATLDKNLNDFKENDGKRQDVLRLYKKVDDFIKEKGF